MLSLSFAPQKNNSSSLQQTYLNSHRSTVFSWPIARLAADTKRSARQLKRADGSMKSARLAPRLRSALMEVVY